MQETSDRRFKPTTRLRVDIAHKDNGTEEVLHGYTLSGSQTQLQNSSLFCTKPHPCKSRRRDSGFCTNRIQHTNNAFIPHVTIAIEKEKTKQKDF